jgi:hypothetical protein
LSLENPVLKEALKARRAATQAAAAAAKEVIAADPKSETGFEAMSFVINSGGPTPDIITLLTEHHVSNPKIGSILSRLSFGPPNPQT